MEDDYSKRLSAERRAEATAEKEALLRSSVLLIIVSVACIYVSLVLQYALSMIDYRLIFFAVYFAGFMLTALAYYKFKERLYQKYYKIYLQEEMSTEK